MFHSKSNIGKYAKIFVLPIAAGLLFILACGDDEKQLDLMTPEVPALEEQLVGSWEIISRDGETVEEAFTPSGQPSIFVAAFVAGVVEGINARVLSDVDVIIAGEVDAEILREEVVNDVIVVSDDVAEILKEKKEIDDFDVDVFVVADVCTTVSKSDMFFAVNGSVFMNFSFVSRGRAAIDVVGGGIDLDNIVYEVVMKFSFPLKGTYTASGSTLTMVLEDANPDLDLDFKAKIGEGDWEDVVERERVEEMEREWGEEIEREFRRDFALDIDHFDVDLSGDTLTLTDDESSKMVLKKR